MSEAAHPVLPTVETPPTPDIAGGRGRLVTASSGNVFYWDKATTVGKTPVTLFDDSEVRISPIAAC